MMDAESSPPDITARFERYAERVNRIDSNVEDLIRRQDEDHEVLEALSGDLSTRQRARALVISIVSGIFLATTASMLWLVRTTYDADNRSRENAQALDRVGPAVQRFEVQLAEMRGDMRALTRALMQEHQRQKEERER